MAVYIVTRQVYDGHYGFLDQESISEEVEASSPKEAKALSKWGGLPYYIGVSLKRYLYIVGGEADGGAIIPLVAVWAPSAEEALEIFGRQHADAATGPVVAREVKSL